MSYSVKIPSLYVLHVVCLCHICFALWLHTTHPYTWNYPFRILWIKVCPEVALCQINPDSINPAETVGCLCLQSCVVWLAHTSWWNPLFLKKFCPSIAWSWDWYLTSDPKLLKTLYILLKTYWLSETISMGLESCLKRCSFAYFWPRHDL